MIIWGSKGKTKTISQGQFMCPACRTVRPYELKQIGKYFTLYFIPLFQTQTLAEYVECQVCFTTYKSEVLIYSSQIEDEIRIETERNNILEEISNQLESGVSIQTIYTGLRNAGVPDNTIGSILYTVTNGQVRECNNCKAVYNNTIRYCSNCGTILPSPKTL